MCGHVSIYYKNKNHNNLNIESLAEKINHRGPNYTGFFKDENIELAFKRLSIIDISGGSQPFKKDGKTMVFNGEIYNYKELKEELINKGYEFSTESDTEVLLTTYLELGEECVHILRGMFAFLIYDEKTKEVFGARDHFGIKPLYYTENDDFIAIASEYKAIVDLLDNIEVNMKSLQSYLSFQYVLPNETMIKEIKQVPSGHSFTIKNGVLKFEPYHSVELLPKREITTKDVRDIMEDSIEHHLMANVDVGTFLSGGVDSSIVATIASQRIPNIKSFSVGFGVEGYDELEVAKKTADKLGIENIQIKVSQEEYIRALPEVFYHLDDPVADPSEVGIYFLSKEAAKHVTVVLSGEGADELFGGYNIYKEYNSVKNIANMPGPVKSIIKTVSNIMPDMKGKSYLYRATTELEDRYIGNAKIFENIEVQKIVKNYNENYEYQKILEPIYKEARNKKYDYVATMQHVDMNTWLKGDILQKADKMSMAASIELRVPFLDIDVLRVAENLRLDQKISKDNTKVLLREAFNDVVPEHVVQKKKLGFPTPTRVWLKDKLGNVVRQTISEAKVDDLINKAYALKLLDDHINDVHDNSRKIWTIFSFCLWHMIFIENKKVTF
ncbi:asparagine synthase (glutamine-hydrolyzing) [Romboutsia weinsteinii]|uniref:asparagine synthase (glutamine-hydrolyzing) n=1 Tax=Romboutsia weinsteinii TaxID=2020949 RepID=A0A371J2S1_9FIRM|nr:asparagine synthase (glutamine-hydrolyzing) [Romboutsia weinsteinii]RDY26958.1 asparagine synthase (glutamine-hydrolyzing) [Romboutsia weinsteinii]